MIAPVPTSVDIISEESDVLYLDEADDDCDCEDSGVTTTGRIAAEEEKGVVTMAKEASVADCRRMVRRVEMARRVVALRRRMDNITIRMATTK